MNSNSSSNNSNNKEKNLTNRRNRKIKKSVTFRQNRNKVHNIPTEQENINARKSIVVNNTNKNNMNMYSKRKTRKQLKIRGNAYRNYLNIKRKNFGEYHLEPNEKKFLNSMV